MSTKLYVGNLPRVTQVSDLEEAFAAYPSIVKIDILFDRVTQQSRGFGFVELSDDEEAKNLINDFNGKDFGGRRLDVNVARPQGERPAGGGRDDRRGGGYNSRRSY